MPEIAFLMGKSSSGKDHIFKAVVEDESLCLNTITMYTTRPMRAGEAGQTLDIQGPLGAVIKNKC